MTCERRLTSQLDVVHAVLYEVEGSGLGRGHGVDRLHLPWSMEDHVTL